MDTDDPSSLVLCVCVCAWQWHTFSCSITQEENTMPSSLFLGRVWWSQPKISATALQSQMSPLGNPRKCGYITQAAKDLKVLSLYLPVTVFMFLFWRIAMTAQKLIIQVDEWVKWLWMPKSVFWKVTDVDVRDFHITNLKSSLLFTNQSEAANNK